MSTPPMGHKNIPQKDVDKCPHPHPLVSHKIVLTWLANSLDMPHRPLACAFCNRATVLLKRTASVVTLGIVRCAVDDHNVIISDRNDVANTTKSPGMTAPKRHGQIFKQIVRGPIKRCGQDVDQEVEGSKAAGS
jgi:hypothetical protein